MKEIAGILNIAPRTVAFHKYQIMGALGAKSNAELVSYAVRNHLVAALTNFCYQVSMTGNPVTTRREKRSRTPTTCFQ